MTQDEANLATLPFAPEVEPASPGLKERPLSSTESETAFTSPRVIRVWLDPEEPAPELRPDLIKSLHRPDATVIVGFVVDDESGTPLPDVQVVVRTDAGESSPPPIEVQTNPRGFFQITVPCRPEAEVPIGSGTLTFSHSGYRPQSFARVEIWPNGDCTYRVRLLREECLDAVDPSLSPAPPSWSAEPAGAHDESPAIAGASEPSPPPLELNASPTTPLGLAVTTLRLPRGIRVLTSDNKTIDYVSLDYYCRRVLPAEWIAGWAAYPGGGHCLNAGAVAIRTYAVGYINHPRAATYDICGTTSCQVYGPATSTYTDLAVRETSSYLMSDSAGSIPTGLTEYSAENNSLGSACGDGFTAPASGCLSDSVCAGQARNGHGRGLCQWGSARWATGLLFPGNSTRDHSSTNGQPRKDWEWILHHYYSSLRLSQAAPLEVGDSVRSLTTLNTRACADGSISNGAGCPIVAVQPPGTIGVIIGEPVQVLSDGAGYTWYQVQWPSAVGWSVENYLERFVDRPYLQASAAESGIVLWWTAAPGVSYRVQFKEQLDADWQDLTSDFTPTGSVASWTDQLSGRYRWYRVVVIPRAKTVIPSGKR